MLYLQKKITLNNKRNPGHKGRAITADEKRHNV